MKWNSALYDQRHAFVFRYGEEVVALLNPQPGERILDIGCGTGHLTQQIAAAGAQVVGLDNSPDMIAAAQTSYPGIEFVVADAADFRFAEPFDAIFSNAALHWVANAEQAMHCMARALKPGGRLVVELGGKGNIATIHNAMTAAIDAVAQLRIDPGRHFPSVAEYAGLAERQGLAVTYAALIDRPTRLADGANGLRNWIAMFDQGVLSQIPADQHAEIIDRVEQATRARLFVDGVWVADYKRLRMVAVKP